MTESVYKIIEIVGTSKDSNSAAIKAAIDKARKTLRGLSWYEVVEQRGYVSDNGDMEFQVKIKVGFKLD